MKYEARPKCVKCGKLVFNMKIWRVFNDESYCDECYKEIGNIK